MFGQGFVTLRYLGEMPAHEFVAWKEYVIEFDRLAEKRKAEADHKTAMDAARKALTR